MTSDYSHLEVSCSEANLAMNRPSADRPDWVPTSGHLSHRTGIQFDVVRILGEPGLEVAGELLASTEGKAGPIVSQPTGRAVVFFVLPLASAEQLSWPPGVFPHGAHWHEYVAIPALDNSSGTVRWESRPTSAHEFVDPVGLHALVCRLMHWPEGSP